MHRVSVSVLHATWQHYRGVVNENVLSASNFSQRARNHSMGAGLLTLVVPRRRLGVVWIHMKSHALTAAVTAAACFASIYIYKRLKGKKSTSRWHESARRLRIKCIPLLTLLRCGLQDTHVGTSARGNRFINA